jgi:hypothetical protein
MLMLQHQSVLIYVAFKESLPRIQTTDYTLKQPVVEPQDLAWHMWVRKTSHICTRYSWLLVLLSFGIGLVFVGISTLLFTSATLLSPDSHFF